MRKKRIEDRQMDEWLKDTQTDMNGKKGRETEIENWMDGRMHRDLEGTMEKWRERAI